MFVAEMLSVARLSPVDIAIWHVPGGFPFMELHIPSLQDSKGMRATSGYKHGAPTEPKFICIGGKFFLEQHPIS